MAAGGTATAVAVAPTLVERATSTVVVRSEGFAVVAIAVCAVGTVLLGVFPSPVLDLIDAVARFLQ